MNPRLAFAATLVLTAASVGEARAEETCESAFEAADLHLRPSESHLLDARAALRACALPTCKSWMIDDCSKRLAEVEGRIPSVALSAEDGRGTPLHEVRILEGDREVVARLNGVAIEIDPGPHVLVAEYEGMRVSRSVVVVEGKKAQQVVVTFASVAPPPPPASAPAPDAKPAFAYPWARPFAGGLAVASVLAIGTGAILGAVAIGKKEDAHCDASNLCDAEPLGEARSTARASTALFALGGALALGSAFTFFVWGNARVSANASVGRVGFTTRF